MAGDDRSEFKLPSREAVAVICRRYLDVLLPVFYDSVRPERDAVGSDARWYLRELETLLADQICRAVRFDLRRRGQPAPTNLEDCAGRQVDEVFSQLPELSRLLASDIEAAFHNDPAAPSREEILLSYPCIEAISVQRLAHRLYLAEVPFIPRMMTEVAHNHTGIDIHPGAAIGESLFIDHGTGVVIGETATIGSKVTFYHGVTLGAFNPLIKDETGQPRRGQANKRHPDLEDHVTVYPNATILGGETRIGHHSIIGGNVWLTHSVAPYSKVTLKEPELVILNGIAR
ncbi:MAG: serine O-acetyltransferase [Acidobacteriia bacterium]|nr:serine O-acetyltransferase [Terriglobia bacterium]